MRWFALLLFIICSPAVPAEQSSASPQSPQEIQLDRPLEPLVTYNYAMEVDPDGDASVTLELLINARGGVVVNDVVEAVGLTDDQLKDVKRAMERWLYRAPKVDGEPIELTVIRSFAIRANGEIVPVEE